MEVIKILGTASALTGIGTTVPGIDNIGAHYVLASNCGVITSQTILQKTETGTEIGSIVVPPSCILIIKKERTDTLETPSGDSIYVSSVVYQG